MVIIAYLGNSVNEYIDQYQTLLGSMEFFCENHPEQRLSYHGTYTRTVKDFEADIPIQRLIWLQMQEGEDGRLSKRYTGLFEITPPVHKRGG